MVPNRVQEVAESDECCTLWRCVLTLKQAIIWDPATEPSALCITCSATSVIACPIWLALAGLETDFSNLAGQGMPYLGRPWLVVTNWSTVGIEEGLFCGFWSERRTDAKKASKPRLTCLSPSPENTALSLQNAHYSSNTCALRSWAT